MKWMLLTIGALTFLAGLLTLPLPLPTGLALMAAGTAIAYPHSRQVRLRVHRLARRRPEFERLLARLRR